MEDEECECLYGSGNSDVDVNNAVADEDKMVLTR